MSKKNTHSDLIVAFTRWMQQRKGKAMSTATNYAATVSAAIHKHARGWTDAAGLERYLLTLAVEPTSQARSFVAGWKLFQEFQREQGVEVAELPALERVEIGPPSAAVYDLRACLHRIPMGVFADLRWRCVRMSGQAVYVEPVLDTGRTIMTQLSPKGVEALNALRLWGYPNGVPGGYALIIPDTPDAEMGLSATKLSRLIQRERASRTPTNVRPVATFDTPVLPQAEPTGPRQTLAQFLEVRPTAAPTGRPVFGPGSASDPAVIAQESKVTTAPAGTSTSTAGADGVFTVPDSME